MDTYSKNKWYTLCYIPKANSHDSSKLIRTENFSNLPVVKKIDHEVSSRSKGTYRYTTEKILEKIWQNNNFRIAVQENVTA
jgi:hypothetical protein